MPKEITLTPSFLIGGTDPSQRKLKLKEVLQTAGVDEGDLDLETIVADSKPISDWIGSVSQYPFMGDKRVLIVRNVCRINPKNVGAKPTEEGEETEEKVVRLDKNHPYIKQFSTLEDHSLIILVADDETGQSGERRYHANLPSWKTVIEKSGGTYIDTTEKVSNPVNFAHEYATQKGKKLSQPNAKLIVEMLQGHPADIRAEIDKLVLYAGDSEEISKNALEAVVKPNLEYNVFKMIDSIISGNSGNALKWMNTLFTKAEKIEHEAFPRVFPVLANQFRNLWQARIVLDSGHGINRLDPKTLSQMPVNSSLLKSKDWIQDKTLRTARNVSYNQLSQVFSIMIEADARMKGLRPAFNGYETLEQMVLKLSAVFKRR